jgi:hypothetical protein
MKKSPSGYKGVSKRMVYGRQKWIARKQIGGSVFETIQDTEREAAVQYDLFLMRNGLEPVNVFKRK